MPQFTVRALSLTVFMLSLVHLSTAGFAADRQTVDRALESTLARALPRMGCNLSPRMEKPVWREIDGVWQIVKLVPARGSIVASPSLDNPDYYFHWNRDSALVVQALIRLLPRASEELRKELHDFLADFIRFSARLQASANPFGLGEVRYNVDGSQDTILWSRPQLDGPALRAISLLSYRQRYARILTPELLDALDSVIRTDLDYIAAHHRESGFDLWEYSRGQHFYTRAVQAAALHAGSAAYPDSPALWTEAARDLRELLRAHWTGSFYSFSHGEVFNLDGQPVGQPGGGLDASVVFAAIHAPATVAARHAEFSFLDSRLLATVWRLEEYFRRAFPLNQNFALGPAIGRHEGDGYYGGNAFFFLTSGYAELYFRLARHFEDPRTESYTVDEWNRPLLTTVLARELALGENILVTEKARAEAFRKFQEKGDAFLVTMVRNVPANGMMAEQFSKVDGSPASAHDLTWSYSSFLSAALAREEAEGSTVDFRKLSLTCSRE